jgi:dihydrofolate reductase
MTEIIIVVAIANNGVIGHQGRLPWHLPSDLRHFKQTTFGFPVIMGRKTYEAIGKPLPGRDNIVLTRDPGRVIPGCQTVLSLSEAVDLCRIKDKVFIIGGGDIFRMALPITDTIIVTALERAVVGDVTFPPINPEHFAMVSSQRYLREEPYSIIRYERVSH